MGLSNEERYTKFFWSAMGFRRNLAELAQRVGDERVDWTTDERCGAIVRGWVRTMDHMVGEMHQKTAGGGSAYWLMGESETSLRGLLSEPYNLRVDAEPETFILATEPEYETVGWWSRKADHSMTADRLQGHPYQSHKGLKELALWWDAYGFLSALSYPLNRYKDKCFPKSIHKAFTQLSGEMINRRFEVCFGAADDDAPRIEQYLLVKHNAFHSLLEEEMKKRQGDDYLKKKFDGYKLYEQVAKMTAKDLSDHFEKKRDAKYEWERKYHADEEKKREANPKASGLFGPKVTPPAEEPKTEAQPKKTKRAPKK